MAEEWGPWIDHDGRGMPVPKGTIVMVESFSPNAEVRGGVFIAGVTLVKSWHWSKETRDRQSASPIDRYRVKKPKGLTILKDILENLPQDVDA